MEAFLFNIQRFSTRDGPGIRTTAFFQGCNLRCAWCHNPESISPEPKLQYYADKCVSCGGCVAACAPGAHTIIDGIHHFEPSKCQYCGECAQYCPTQAILTNAKRYTPVSLARVLLKDLAYYQNSGGGVTVSGGEPMLQAGFVAELFTLLQAEGVHTAIDTAANVAWRAFERVLPVTSLFLVDLKSLDAGIHRRFTGVDNAAILENIRRLCACGANIELRLPLIRGVNASEEDARQTAAFLAALPYAPPVRLLAYHSYGLYKAESVGMKMQPFQPPESLAPYANMLGSHQIHVEVS